MKLNWDVEDPDLNVLCEVCVNLTLVLQVLFAKQEQFTFLPNRLIAVQNQEIKEALFKSKESGHNMIHHLYFRRWVVGFEARGSDHYVVAKRGMWPLIHTADGVPLSASVQWTEVSGLTSAAAPHEAQVIEACHLVLHHTRGVAQLGWIILVVARHDRDHCAVRYVSQSNHLWESDRQSGNVILLWLSELLTLQNCKVLSSVHNYRK